MDKRRSGVAWVYHKVIIILHKSQFFSCGKQLYRRLCLSVCLPVCLSLCPSVCLCLSRTFYHVSIAGSSWNLHQTLISWTACGTYNLRSKGQRSRSQGSFEDFVVSALWLHGYFTNLLYTWYKYSPWHDDVSRSIFRSKGQRSRSHRSFQMKVTRVVRSFSCPYWTDSLHMWYIHNPWGNDVSRTISGSKGRRSRSWGSFEVLAVSAPWLRPYWTDSLHMWYTHNPSDNDVSRTTSGSKGQRSRSRGSFEVMAVSASWLRPYWTDSLHMWYTHNPWGDDVSRTISGSKGQGHARRSRFWPCPLRGSVPIGPILFICGTHTTNEVTKCRAPFPGQKVKGQGHAGRSKFWPCPLRGSVPIGLIHFICSTHTTHEVMMCRALFPGQKVKGQGHTGRSNFWPYPLRGPVPKVQCHAGRSYVNCGLWAAKGCRSY